MIYSDELRRNPVLQSEPSVWDESARGLGIHGDVGKVIGGLVVRAVHVGSLSDAYAPLS